LVRSAVPVDLNFFLGAIETPGANPKVIAMSAVFMLVSKTPPCSTKFLRFSTPIKDKPGRMPSVESGLPMLGVAGVFFHGSGLPHSGIPATIACGVFRPAGGKTTTSYLDRRFGSRATACVLMYVNGTFASSRA